MAPTLVRIRAEVTLVKSIGSRWAQTIFVKYSSIEIGHIFSAVLMNLTGLDKMPIFESFWFSSALKETLIISQLLKWNLLLNLRWVEKVIYGIIFSVRLYTTIIIWFWSQVYWTYKVESKYYHYELHVLKFFIIIKCHCCAIGQG